MRSEIISSIHQFMQQDSSVYFLTGDLGYHVLEDIEKEFPKRFMNIGIAEQNMMGIASGLALSGKKVFVYSIIPFVTMRCFEQIRNDIAYHNLDIAILGVGAGLSYGILSNTHFALEDVAILRVLPNMHIFSPADGLEAKLGMPHLFDIHGPKYVRIGKREEPKVYSEPYKFQFGKAHELSQGNDIAIFTTGPITYEVLQALKLLKQQGISTQCLNIHTIKPLDTTSILQASKNKKLLVTIEEHGKIGGLGSAVAEVVSAQGTNTPLLRIGVEDKLLDYVGSQHYLRTQLQIDAEGIFTTIQKHI